MVAFSLPSPRTSLSCSCSRLSSASGQSGMTERSGSARCARMSSCVCLDRFMAPLGEMISCGTSCSRSVSNWDRRESSSIVARWKRPTAVSTKQTPYRCVSSSSTTDSRYADASDCSMSRSTSVPDVSTCVSSRRMILSAFLVAFRSSIWMRLSTCSTRPTLYPRPISLDAQSGKDDSGTPTMRMLTRPVTLRSSSRCPMSASFSYSS